MTKSGTAMIAALICTLAIAAVVIAGAQTANTNAPTKVTGDGVKTASGLQYWDIKVGAGDAAKSGSHVWDDGADGNF